MANTHEVAGRADDGCVDAKGNVGKKLLRPGARRCAEDRRPAGDPAKPDPPKGGAMTQKGYLQRQACALAGIDPLVYRRPPK